MANPTLQQVHVNRPLTNLSTAYIQDQADFISTKVFPIVPVDKKSDLYYTYNKNDWFRDEAKQRGPGTESAGGGYGLSTATYNCLVWAWHHDVSDQERENTDQPLDPDTDATLLTSQKLLLKQEITWSSQYFTTAIWGTDITGVAAGSADSTHAVKWSDYTNSDPLTDVRTGRSKILTNTGFLPNTLVLGYNVFEYLSNHPEIVDRYKYTNSDVITEEMLARLFKVDRVLVAKAVKATNVENETEAYSLVQGDSALLCYAAPRPGLRTPSAGYTFAWKGISAGLGTNTTIASFYLQWLKSTRIEGEAAWDQHVVGTDLGYFYSVIV